MTSLEMPLRTMWSEVSEVRDRVQALFADLPEEVRDATVVTASELVENAIKYGESVPEAPQATVAVERRDDTVRVTVRNGIASEETARELCDHIGRLAAAPDKMQLYIARLQELMTSGGGSTRLGLYRIGCEAGFDLACDYSNRVVTVIAIRRVPPGTAQE